MNHVHRVGNRSQPYHDAVSEDPRCERGFVGREGQDQQRHEQDEPLEGEQLEAGRHVAGQEDDEDPIAAVLDPDGDGGMLLVDFEEQEADAESRSDPSDGIPPHCGVCIRIGAEPVGERVKTAEGQDECGFHCQRTVAFERVGYAGENRDVGEKLHGDRPGGVNPSPFFNVGKSMQEQQLGREVGSVVGTSHGNPLGAGHQDHHSDDCDGQEVERIDPGDAWTKNFRHVAFMRPVES